MRTAWNFPHDAISARDSAPALPAGHALSRLFMGIIASSVKGQFARISAAPMIQRQSRNCHAASNPSPPEMTARLDCMAKPRTSSVGEADALTSLILEVFRLNGCLILAGDDLVSDLGLTSARWQVLGAMALAPAAETVARLARSMGLRRQGVQRIVNELAAEGIVVLEDNPHHRRAKLVRLTKMGEELFQAAGRRQRPWAKRLARGLDARTIDSARGVLETLRKKLEIAAFDD